jgi:hypothetical protein
MWIHDTVQPQYYSTYSMCIKLWVILNAYMQIFDIVCEKQLLNSHYA